MRGVAGVHTPANDLGLGAGSLPVLLATPLALILSTELVFPTLPCSFDSAPTTGDGGAIDPAVTIVAAEPDKAEDDAFESLFGKFAFAAAAAAATTVQGPFLFSRC